LGGRLKDLIEIAFKNIVLQKRFVNGSQENTNESYDIEARELSEKRIIRTKSPNKGK